MNEKFNEYIKTLEKKGYMINRDSNDVDRIYPPGESVTISGWYRDMNIQYNPPGLNWRFFCGYDAEKFAEEVRKAGYTAFVHGWYQGKYTEASVDTWTDCWIYDVEIVEKEA